MATLVVSYSRVDRPQVRAVVALLKAALRGVDRAVFWDEDFEPGEPWFEQLCQHIDAAPQLFVFWCEHAAQSPQVRREFSYAMQRGKRVVPVLMDNTALVPELAQIHGIDLRDALQHRESSPPNRPEVEARPSPARAAAAGRLVAIAGAVVLGVAVLVGTIMWTLSSVAPESGGVPNDTPPLPQASGAGSLAYVLLIAGAIALLVTALVMLRARRARRMSAPPLGGAVPAIPSWRRERIISAFEPFIPDGRSET
jgi:hypothetical protein